MRIRLLPGILLGLLFALFLVQGCKTSTTTHDKNGISVSDKVLKTADWAGYKYEATLEKAKANDNDAIKSLLLFHGTLDGVERLEHTTTCVELAALLGDRRMAEAIVALGNPRLNDVLKSSVQMAMTKTTNPELQNKPFENRFPLMWLAVNGQQLPQEISEGEQIRKQRQMEEAKTNTENAAKPAENDSKN